MAIREDKEKETQCTDDNKILIFDDLPLLEPINGENNLHDDSDCKSDLENLDDLAGMVSKDNDKADEGKVVRDEEEIVNIFEA